MLNQLFRIFSPAVWRNVLHHDPMIEGRFRLETREGGKRRAVREGKNIWTLTGREYLSELIALGGTSPRSTFRDDRVAYVGMGIGAQPEVADIVSLVEPITYQPSLYLAPLETPATFPASGTSGTRTSVQFVREFATTELSLGTSVVLTEAGLFTDGEPSADWALSAIVVSDSAFDRAPVAYKTFEPITKTTQFTLRLVWEIRIA